MTSAPGRYRKPSLAALLTALVVAGAARAEADPERALATRVSVRWGDAPLGPSLERLREATGAPLWLDRRVDKRLTVDLDARDLTIDEVVTRCATRLGLDVARWGGALYVGPPGSAERLARVGLAARAAGRRDPRLRRVLAERRPLAWPSRSAPREVLVERLALGSLVANPDAVPHDLWPAASLPAAEGADRLTLLLYGFDLTWRVDRAGDPDRPLRIVPIGEDAAPPR